MKKKVMQVALQLVPNTESIRMTKTRYGTIYSAVLKDGSTVNITDRFKAICMGAAFEKLEEVCRTL